MSIVPTFDPRFPPLIKPLSKKELGEWLSCSERFLELEVKAGRLRKVQMGAHRVRFLPKDVNEWLEAGGSTAKARKVRSRKAALAQAQKSQPAEVSE